jgi:ubiquinone biosynthesis protein
LASALLTTVGNIDRLRQITQVLVKHGFGELVARTDLAALVPFRKTDPDAPKTSFAVRLRLAMQELGPSFVKLGQILSTRSDLLPLDIVQELKKLQEDVPPIAFDDVRAEIEETVGASLADVFESFDERPLASASIGQVHRARLKTPAGPVDVAVKVQRPKIRTTIERDLDLLYLMARLLERAVPESTIYSPTGLVGEFDRAITAELDYTLEAGNGEKFARNFEGNPQVRFPKVFREVSGRKVLVAEFFEGAHIEKATRELGFSGERIAKSSVNIIAQMIFVDGVFHADPHPGNIRIMGTPEEPVIGMLDLGLIGTLAPDMRDKAIDLMLAAVKKDTKELADALLAMGKPRGKVDRDAFDAHVAKLAEIHLGRSLKEIQLAAMIRDLVQGAVQFEIEMPVEMMMVGKALMTVEGIGKSIYPELDVFAEARPFFMKLLWQRYSPEKLGQRLLRAASRLSGAATEVPPLLAEVLDDVRRGRLKLQAEDPGLGRAAERLGRRIALGAIGAALVVCGTWAQLGGHGRMAVWMWILAGIAAIGAWGRVPDSVREKLKRR